MSLRTAAQLLFGAPPGRIDAPRDAERFVELLRRNRVPVAVLAESAAIRDLAHQMPELAAFVASERERLEYATDAYREVAEAWTDAGISCVLIKSPGFFPYTSSNVDVLVPAERAERACGVLESLGYAELPAIREPYKRLFRRARAPKLGFAVHVHTGVAWVTRFLTDADVLRSSRTSPEAPWLRYPGAEEVFLINTAHWLYEDKEMTLRDLYHAELAIRDGVRWDALRAKATAAGWRDGFELGLTLYRVAAHSLGLTTLGQAIPPPDRVGPRLARRAVRPVDDGTSVISLNKAICKGLQLVKTGRDPALDGTEKAREMGNLLWATARQALFTRPGGRCVAVAVSGPDGAGKTTFAREMHAWLSGELGLPAEYHWTRLATSQPLDALKTVGTRVVSVIPTGARPESGHVAGDRERALRAESPPPKALLTDRPRVRHAWCCVLFVDFGLRLWMRTLKAELRGGIHVFDRHMVDAVVDLEAIYGFHLPAWSLRLLPHPDVMIVIDATSHSDELPSPAVVGNGRDALEIYESYAGRADVVVPGREPPASAVSRTAPGILLEYARTRRPRTPPFAAIAATEPRGAQV